MHVKSLLPVESLTSQPLPLRVGAAYTRDEISERCGGGRRTCLPTRDGVVVAACLLKTFNPQAPHVILCGVGVQNGPAGERLATQCEPLPVFMKATPTRWIYQGRFRVVGACTSGRRFDAAVRKSDRPAANVSRAVFLEPA